MPESATTKSERVMWKNKIYVALMAIREDASTEHHVKFFSKLLVLSPDISSWNVIATLPWVTEFALSTYHSKLVLVGGKEQSVFSKCTNKLWASGDGINWQPSLPPMPTKRFSPVAVNTGDPEYLVVAGGVVPFSHMIADVAEVWLGKEWATLQPLPLRYHNIAHTLHNGNLFLGGSQEEMEQLSVSIAFKAL